MALPVTIAANIHLPEHNLFVGPFIDGNDNVYIFAFDDTSTDLGAFKATDPEDSFAEQDTGNRPSYTTGKTVWAFQDGDTIHIIGQDSAEDVQYDRFYTSDHATLADTWETQEDIETPADEPSTADKSNSIVVRSDSTVVVIYSGGTDAIHGTAYDRVDYNIRSSGGTWGGPVALDAGGTVDYLGSVAVLDTDNNMTHFLFEDQTNGDGKHRSLTSGDSLSAVEDVDTAVSAVGHVFTPGFYTLDGAVHRIRVGYLDSNDKISLCRIDDDGSPAVTVDISGNTVFDVNDSPVAGLAVDGTDGHLLYANNADQDIFHDTDPTPHTSANWGTGTEFLDGVTINRISCKVIDRSGKKLAMVYDNAGAIQYNELDLGAAAGQEVLHRPKLAGSLLIRGSVI